MAEIRPDEYHEDAFPLYFRPGATASVLYPGSLELILLPFKHYEPAPFVAFLILSHFHGVYLDGISRDSI